MATLRGQSLSFPALFADGGIIGRNPSSIGGTWAWCLVDATGQRIATDSGFVLTGEGEVAHRPEDAEAWTGEVVTNNVTELVALVRGLEALPTTWRGAVCSDSQITLGRLFSAWAWNGIPDAWVERALAAMVRFAEGALTPVLLQGHPTRTDLAAGIGAKRRLPVSEHNVFVDRLCNEAAERFLEGFR